MSREGFEPTTLCSSVVRALFMRSMCRGVESRSGHLIFFPAFVLYLEGISELNSLMMNNHVFITTFYQVDITMMVPKLNARRVTLAQIIELKQP